MASVNISDGFIFVDGVKICQYDKATKTFLFYDKDKRRCSKRGKRTVEISSEKFIEILEKENLTALLD